MHWFLGLFCALIPLSVMASENLIENLRGQTNSTLVDGVVHQVAADTNSNIWWKFQIWYNNQKHQLYNGAVSMEQLWVFENKRTGFLSYTFITPDDLEDLGYFRFALNGAKIDTSVIFGIKDIQPNTPYTLQWRVLNTTQGEIAWDNMFLTSCADGTALPLGMTQCAPLCPVGTGRLHAGDGQYRLWAQKIDTPALAVGIGGQVCYGHLMPGVGTGLNLRWDGAAYHLE